MLSKQAWIHPWKHDRHNFLSFLGHFLPFYPPNNLENQAFPKKWKCAWKYYRFTHMYYKWQSYDVWFLWYRVRRAWFFVILEHFLLFYCPNNLKYQNFEKMRKSPGDIIILHMCTIITIIWHMVPEILSATDRIFCHFGQFFVHLPPKNPKNQNFEKMKKAPGDIILHKCTKNHDHMLCCSWDTMHDGCNSYFLFWAIFCPFTLLTTQKIKILKK